MNAIHALCLGTNKSIKNFELLTMILSALNWKKYNGEIKLVADELGIKYIEKHNLNSIWDDIELLEMPSEFNHKPFWAAGKLYALKQQKVPCVLIDNDFIVWKNIEEYLKNDIVVAHTEDISKNYCYPEKEYFKMKKEYFKMNKKYKFNSSYSWKVKPCNTAFLYIKDLIFKDFYISESLNFMRNCIEAENDVCSMVFAEQRLLAMCADQWNINISTLMDENNIFYQHDFTHVWGYKDTLSNDLVKNEQFCSRCIKRIIHDYPGIIPTLENIINIQSYI